MGVSKGHVYVEYGCACGETSSTMFYQTRKAQCKKCFNESQMSKWKANKLQAVLMKGGMCSVCSYSRCIGALEFHHTDPSTKEFNWTKKWTLSWSKIEKMLEGTILVCSNCHRELHEKLRSMAPLA